MSKLRRFLVAFSVLALLASACDSSTEETATTPSTAAPTTTSSSAAPPVVEEGPEPLDPDGFYLNLMWHQHQPLYPKNENGVVTRPWVRVHATKDYYDMAAMLEEFPDIKATFNLTPVLLRQLEELSTGTKDLYWTHTEIDAAELSDEEFQFIVERFFDVNPKVIDRFPRYQELRELRESGARWSNTDIRDLQVLFNLA